MFSAFYLPLLATLLCLIVRGVAFEWRARSDGSRWRGTWLTVGVVASFAPPFLWGPALANLLSGIPLDGKSHFTGSVGDLFSAYTVFAGLAVVALFAFHGATFLVLRTSGALCERAAVLARRLAVPAVVAVVAFLAWTVAVAVDHNDRGVLGPAVPAALGALAVAGAAAGVLGGRSGWAFGLPAVATVAWIATVFTGLYPRVLVSDPTFANSLTVSGAAAEHYALVGITVVAAIFTPLVLFSRGRTYGVLLPRVGGKHRGPPAVPAPPPDAPVV